MDCRGKSAAGCSEVFRRGDRSLCMTKKENSRDCDPRFFHRPSLFLLGEPVQVIEPNCIGESWYDADSMGRPTYFYLSAGLASSSSNRQRAALARYEDWPRGLFECVPR